MALAHPIVVFTVVPHVYALTVLAAVIRRRDAIANQPFTWRRFYVLMGWAPATYLALGALSDWRYLVMFVACGGAGVVGELLVSIAWRHFFGAPIWTYSHGAFAAGFSSTLNFLPWAIGAFLFHSVGLQLRAHTFAPDLPYAVGVTLAALALGCGVSWPALLASRRRTLSPHRFTLFCIPILCVAVALAVRVDWRFVPLMLAFSLVGFVTEYAYGRTMSAFFRRSLWRYNPWPLDHGHTSPVTLPLWALGGLFFHFITQAIIDP